MLETRTSELAKATEFLRRAHELGIIYDALTFKDVLFLNVKDTQLPKILDDFKSVCLSKPEAIFRALLLGSDFICDFEVTDKMCVKLHYLKNNECKILDNKSEFLHFLIVNGYRRNSKLALQFGYAPNF